MTSGSCLFCVDLAFRTKVYDIMEWKRCFVKGERGDLCSCFVVAYCAG